MIARFARGLVLVASASACTIEAPPSTAGATSPSETDSTTSGAQPAHVERDFASPEPSESGSCPPWTRRGVRIEGELVVAVGEVRGIDNPSLARSTATARAIASAATKLNGGRQVRVEGAVVTDRTECGGITFAEVRVPLKPKSEPEP